MMATPNIPAFPLEKRAEDTFPVSSWALWHISQLTPHVDFALRLLLTVAAERHSSRGATDPQTTAFHTRFQQWPLATTMHAAIQLRSVQKCVRHVMRQISPKGFPPPFAQSRYRRLYNICLWQRRHPLCVLQEALSAFGDVLSCAEMDALLEVRTERHAAELARVPHTIRCDVLITYSQCTFAQQMQLMSALHRGTVPWSVHPTQTQPQRAGDGEKEREESVFGNEMVSAVPPPPAMFLSDYMQSVPPRFGDNDMESTEYETVRLAFEQHKKDGIKRLLSAFAMDCNGAS